MIALCRDPDYRRALLSAEIAIADSGFMVLLWKFSAGESIPRISGLEHVKRLLEHESVREPGAVVWVVATEESKRKLVDFLAEKADSGKLKAKKESSKDEEKADNGEPTTESGKLRGTVASGLRSPISDLGTSAYVAPKYGRPVEDPELLALVREQQPRHVVIAVGGGIQDQLGRYLLEQLDYRPAVHCIGAALGFFTGDQVRIPDWADRFFLGWLFRAVAQPTVFVPRFWSARRLPWLIWKYRDKLPPLGA